MLVFVLVFSLFTDTQKNKHLDCNHHHSTFFVDVGVLQFYVLLGVSTLCCSVFFDCTGRNLPNRVGHFTHDQRRITKATVAFRRHCGAGRNPVSF
jgi:hypothetical protein